ncbi:hypothetical protein PIB30_110446, partial [Stylosanthes scabra]|nr:hypothetical protein [Stylosanthes scabra]
MIGLPPSKRSFIVISLTVLLVSSWWLKELVANTFYDHVCLVVADVDFLQPYNLGKYTESYQ